MYKGKEVCQGCAKPGTEVSRWDRDSLCEMCKEELAAGRSKKKIKSTEYCSVFLHHYAFRNQELNRFIAELLSSLDNPYIDNVGGVRYIKYATGNNGKYYKIPLKSYEAIVGMATRLDSMCNTLDESIKQLPEKEESAVRTVQQKERHAIFNEGVERGRQLLFQLNKGDITLEDFYAKQTRK